MEMYFVSKGIYNYLEINLGEARELLAKGNYYKIKMVEDNDVSNIIQVISSEVDGQTYIRCNVTSYYVLERMFMKLKPDGELLRLMIMQLLNCITDLENYLLAPEDLMISPEYIFYDLNEKNLKLVYVPGYNVNIRKQVKEFLEYIMKIFDHRDKQGVTLLYEVYNDFLKEDMDLCKLKSRLQESSQFREKEMHYNNLYVEVANSAEENNAEIIRNITKSKIGLVALGIVIFLVVVFLIRYFLFGKKIFNLYLSIGFMVGAVIVAAFFSFKEEENLDEIMREYASGGDIISEERQKVLSGQISELILEEEKNYIQEENIHSLIPLTNGSLETISIKENNSTIVIGRDKKDTDYRLPTTQISRIHACIYKREDGIYVEDRDSTNGTFINYNRLTALTPYRIKKGDVICFANEEFFAS